jgi:hypothetical protein
MNKGTLVLVFLLLAAMVQCGIAQTVQSTNAVTPPASKSIAPQCYQLPFASSGNTIELTIANTATTAAASVKVEATEVPTWLKFKATAQSIATLKANQELPVLFTFSVDKTAPVGKEETIAFRILSSTGETWTKEIRVTVAPPEKFELFQNYPNPFNPSTTISYQLPADSRVHLKVFDLLGREVATVVDETEAAGYYQKRFDATRVSSGMYVYQVVATDKQDNRQVVRKKMLILK